MEEEDVTSSSTDDEVGHLTGARSDSRSVRIRDLPNYIVSSGSSVMSNGLDRDDSPSPPAPRCRIRTLSGSKAEHHMLTTKSGRTIYTKGRPPWYDKKGVTLKQPYVIGICGGSASGKTTVAEKIIEKLGIPWVTILSMDSFYKVLDHHQHKLAEESNYNFDHPDAFDFELLHEVLNRLREGKSTEVPVYDFTTHSRDNNPKMMYGADVLIFEGILAFHRPEINALMDMKVFVDTDGDLRLARRLNRDINERARDLHGVLDQYFRFVKPAFEAYIAPGMKVADIIVPRGGDNDVAINLIVKQVMTQLVQRGYDASAQNLYRQDLVNVNDLPDELPENLTIIKETPQVRGLHTFIRNKNTKRDEIIFYSERLTRILLEEAMNKMNYREVQYQLNNGALATGRRCATDICGVAIMRAGETMENSLRGIVKDCKMGKILIQTNETTHEPELYYLRLPKNIEEHTVLLMDATVATGAAAMMAIRILLDHDVPEENIYLLSLLMSEPGVHALAYAFPKIRLITTAVDSQLSDNFYVLPGMGNFGDRYYGTTVYEDADEPFDS